jgi:hypothetical protein
MKAAPIRTADELAERIREAIDGSQYELHDFGGGVYAVPYPVKDGNDIGLKIILEPVRNAV